MKKVFIQVPATSANCGPGFDTLGLACNLYNEVSYEITDRKGFQLEVEGEGADYLKPFGRNLAFASFLRVWNSVTDGQRIGLKVKMLNRIPMSWAAAPAPLLPVCLQPTLYVMTIIPETSFSVSLRKSRAIPIM